MVRRAAALFLFLACVTCGTPEAQSTAARSLQPFAVGPSHSKSPGDVALTDATPVRLIIPRISVNASIEPRGLDGNRNLATPKDFHNVAWYKLGPAPGLPGNAILNGHVNWWTGSAVFTRLSQLRAGDLVTIVRADGVRLTFKVTSRQTVPWNARISSLFEPRPTSTLTLITCSGPWDSRIATATRRLLVSAVLA